LLPFRPLLSGFTAPGGTSSLRQLADGLPTNQAEFPFCVSDFNNPCGGQRFGTVVHARELKQTSDEHFTLDGKLLIN